MNSQALMPVQFKFLCAYKVHIWSPFTWDIPGLTYHREVTTKRQTWVIFSFWCLKVRFGYTTLRTSLENILSEVLHQVEGLELSQRVLPMGDSAGSGSGVDSALLKNTFLNVTLSGRSGWHHFPFVILPKNYTPATYYLTFHLSFQCVSEYMCVMHVCEDTLVCECEPMWSHYLEPSVFLRSLCYDLKRRLSLKLKLTNWQDKLFAFFTHPCQGHGPEIMRPCHFPIVPMDLNSSIRACMASTLLNVPLP